MTITITIEIPIDERKESSVTISLKDTTATDTEELAKRISEIMARKGRGLG